MTSSGTYDFLPSTGNLTLIAFARIGLRPDQLVAQHWFDAGNEANLLQVEFNNRQPNLWRNELYEQELTDGVASYTLPARMVSPMAVYLSVDPGGTGDNVFDRILGPISTFEYAALPNKETRGQPTTFWFDRQITPIVKLWPVPDDVATYTLKMRILSQIQDAKLPSGVTPDLPYLWFDAFVAALAARLAVIYKPELEDKRKADAERAWQIAAKENIEYVPTYILPMTNGYWR